MRLDKFIATQTELSRSQAKKAIHQGLVTINNHTANDGAQKILEEDFVCLDGNPINHQQRFYLMLYKPQGYICATEDGHHPIALDLISGVPLKGLHFAGRLDLDATGLVLISNDGQWTHRASHPGVGHQKRYRVTTADPIDASYIDAFADGMQLNGEEKPTRPAQLTLFDAHHAELTISEGRYHQVKRMFAAMGNRVTQLHRVAIGSVELDASLQEGDFRHLSKEEIASLT